MWSQQPKKDNERGRARGRSRGRSHGRAQPVARRNLSFGETSTASQQPEENHERGHGRSRGRGRGCGRNRGRSLCFGETSTAPNDLEKLRQQRVQHAKNVRALSAEDKERLKRAIQIKQLSRMLLPDAPESKRKRGHSPDRIDCRFSAGTPTELPPQEKQSWQKSSADSPIIVTKNTTPDRCGTPKAQDHERVITPSSGRSLASYLEVANLSPANWIGGIAIDLEIETWSAECDGDAPSLDEISCSSNEINCSPNESSISINPVLLQRRRMYNEKDPQSEKNAISENVISGTAKNLVIMRASNQSKCVLLPEEHLCPKEQLLSEEQLPPEEQLPSEEQLPPKEKSPHKEQLPPYKQSPPVIVVPNEEALLERHPGAIDAEFQILDATEYVHNSEGSDFSEEDEQENPDVDTHRMPFLSRNAAEPNPAVCSDPNVTHLLRQVDAANDQALRNIAPPDMLFFDWSNDPEKFKGVREKFTDSAGPTFALSDLQSPLDAFKKIWDDKIIDLIVLETNKYADQKLQSQTLKTHSRLKKWTPTNRIEIQTFLAFCMYQSLVPLSVEQDYFKVNGTLALPGLAKIIPYNRFLLLKKFLHFADSSTMPVDLTLHEKRLYKIQPILDHLNEKFCQLYIPGQNIAIDESLLHWSGRLGFAQKIATKAAKIGIKSYELCESATGYLWKFFIYCGAGSEKRQTSPNDIAEEDNTEDKDTTIQMDGHPDVKPDGATAKIVYDLAHSLFGKGHTLIMDNFYNSPLLARCLKTEKTDVLGTLRVAREFVPQSIKSMAKREMRTGEIVFTQTDDLNICLWRDANLVCMISTFHPTEIGAKEKYGAFRYKPKAVLDYNTLMGGVDKKDQLLSDFPIERVRNIVWYKKLFRRLLNVSILNAYILYRCKDTNISQRRFRFLLAELLSGAQQLQPAIQEVKCVKVEKRTILVGNHYVVKGSTKYAVCVWCRKQYNKKVRTTYKCDVCDVSLCLEYCFKNYHTVLD